MRFAAMAAIILMACSSNSDSNSEDAANNADAGAPAPSVVINEVAAKGDPADWFELHNPGTHDIDLSGYSFSDAIEKEPQRANFKDKTMLAAGAYLVVEVTDDWPGFKLAKDEELGLWDTDGTLIDSVDWAAGDSPEGGSFARIPDATGPFKTVEKHTRGTANSTQ